MHLFRLGSRFTIMKTFIMVNLDPLFGWADWSDGTMRAMTAYLTDHYASICKRKTSTKLKQCRYKGYNRGGKEAEKRNKYIAIYIE